MEKAKVHGLHGGYRRPRRDTTWTTKQKLAIVQKRSANTRDEAKNVTLTTPPWEKENDDAHHD